MKIPCSICAALMLLVSCQPKGYTLQGSLTNCPEGSKVYIERYTDAGPELGDSTVVDAKGSFLLKGSYTTPEFVTLVIDTQPTAGRNEKDFRNKVFTTRFYIENAKMKITGDVNKMGTYFYNEDRKVEDPVVTGSKSEDIYQKFLAATREASKKYSELDKRYIKEYLRPSLDGAAVAAVGIEIARETEQAAEVLQKSIIDFIDSQPESIVSLDQCRFLFGGMMAPMSAIEMDAVVAPLRTPWSGTQQLTELEQLLKTVKMTAQGEKYVDADLLNEKGETVKLSDYVTPGKYTMLEFWASWCGPCRGEIPHLRHVNEVYGPKGFEIVSISVDEKADEWIKAMKEEKMVWKQLRAPDSFKSAVCKDYNIAGVPTCIVLDKEGRIAKINMRGAFLDAFLQETYDK